MSNTISVAWLSRHDMKAEQFSALEERLGRKIELISVPTRWSSSGDVDADLDSNEREWRKLLLGYDAVAGVFPPVAYEVIGMLPGRCDETPGGNPREYWDEDDFKIAGKPIFTPVTTRIMKGGKIDIMFHRWIQL